jgi:His-Xaa-Ser system radical SAM maturase HxsC
MTIPLHTHGRPLTAFPAAVFGRITRRPLAAGDRPNHIRLLGTECPAADELQGHAAVLVEGRFEVSGDLLPPLVHSLRRTDHLTEGDVVAVNPNGYVRTLYRIASGHNALFATDRCNSYCVMCSQPPKPVDDSERIAEHLRLLDLIDPETRELGITGGEPTLLKDDLLRIVAKAKERLPRTALHILSNGRLFYYGSFARRLAGIEHPDVMLGIPLYSDLDHVHDFVVQARGAFDETVIGLQNLGRYGVPVEIRVVIHRYTVDRLPQLAEFIYRNFTFAAHVALMGLEPMGFAVPNLEQLWIDPWEYRAELRDATLSLAARGMKPSIYNHQLCVVPEDLWPFCRKSISDWKNDYLPVCVDCRLKGDCGGFFASSVKRKVSSHIRPPTAWNEDAVAFSPE